MKIYSIYPLLIFSFYSMFGGMTIRNNSKYEFRYLQVVDSLDYSTDAKNLLHASLKAGSSFQLPSVYSGKRCNVFLFDTITKDNKRVLILFSAYNKINHDTVNLIVTEKLTANYHVSNYDTLKYTRRTISFDNWCYKSRITDVLYSLNDSTKGYIKLNPIGSSFLRNQRMEFEIPFFKNNLKQVLYLKLRVLISDTMFTAKTSLPYHEIGYSIIGGCDQRILVTPKYLTRDENRSLPPPMEAFDKRAEFEGGESALDRYIYCNIDFEKLQYSAEKKSSIVITFNIESTGIISNIKIYKASKSDEFNKVALNLVTNMPPWIPAQYGGKPKKSSKNIQIFFDENYKRKICK